MQKNILNNHVIWLSLFFLLFLFEFLFFKQYISREFIKYYPTAFDQTSFLDCAYRMYQNVITKGASALFDFTSSNTLLFVPESVLFFLLFGADRAHALLFCFSYFIALQATIIYVTRWLFGHYAVSAIFVGVLLATAIPFAFFGSLTDFRIDFVVFCLYGIFISFCIRSGVFENRKWTVFSAILAATLVLTRCLTSVYLAFILVFLLIYFSIKKEKDRLKNFFWFSGLLGLLTAPFLFYLGPDLYQYYIVRNAGVELSIRHNEFQVYSILDNAAYYYHTLTEIHLGWLCMGLLLLLFFFKWGSFALRKKTIPPSSSYGLALSPSTLGTTTYFLNLAFWVPCTVLIVWPTSSPCVPSVMIAPLIWFVILNTLQSQHSQRYFSMLLLSVLFLGTGSYYWYQKTHHVSHYRYDRVEHRNLLAMYDNIGQYIQTAEWPTTHFLADQLTDYLLSQVLVVLFYENHQKLLNVEPSLSDILLSIDFKSIQNALQRSEVYITNEAPYPRSPYPYNQSINAYRNTLEALAQKDFIELGEYHFYARHFKVFVKPSFSIDASKTDWNFKKRLTVPWQIARRPAQLILKGLSFQASLAQTPMRCTFVDPLLGIHPIQASVAIAHYRYTIKLRLPHNPHFPKMPVEVDCEAPQFIAQKLQGMQEKQVILLG